MSTHDNGGTLLQDMKLFFCIYGFVYDLVEPGFELVTEGLPQAVKKNIATCKLFHGWSCPYGHVILQIG